MSGPAPGMASVRTSELKYFRWQDAKSVVDSDSKCALATDLDEDLESFI